MRRATLRRGDSVFDRLAQDYGNTFYHYQGGLEELVRGLHHMCDLSFTAPWDPKDRLEELQMAVMAIFADFCPGTIHGCWRTDLYEVLIFSPDKRILFLCYWTIVGDQTGILVNSRAFNVLEAFGPAQYLSQVTLPLCAQAHVIQTIESFFAERMKIEASEELQASA